MFVSFFLKYDFLEKHQIGGQIENMFLASQYRVVGAKQ